MASEGEARLAGLSAEVDGFPVSAIGHVLSRCFSFVFFCIPVRTSTSMCPICEVCM